MAEMTSFDSAFSSTGTHHRSRSVAGISFVLHALLPGVVFLVANGAVAALGFEMPATQIGAAFGIDGFVTAAAWILALTSWGLTRWAVAGHGSRGADAADWVTILIAGAVAFPFITLGFDFFWTTVTAFALGLLALATLRRVAGVSGIAALAMAPSIIALLLPGLVGFSILAMGWTPPFALTQSAEAAPAPSIES